MMVIQKAQPNEAEELTGVAFAAKRHWDYPESWIQSWATELTISTDEVTQNPTYKAVVDSVTAGFYWLRINVPAAELNGLWVKPDAMGKGFGRALFEHAEKIAQEQGATRLIIVSDPHALGFYQRMGATVYGQQSAAMDANPRVLSLLDKSL